MSDTPRPTQGQQRILQLCCRTAYVLTGEQAEPDAEMTYQVIERGTGRRIQAMTQRMFQGLASAGWIEPVDMMRVERWRHWTYRVTESGIAAANGPTRGE